MSIEQALLQRSGAKCELCASEENLSVYSLPPENEENAEKSVLLCTTCNSQITNPDTMEANHWRCLNDSMWNPEPAVQVTAWRVLKKLSETESWAQDLLDMLYLEPDVLSWAESGITENSEDDSEPTLDNNGTRLEAGDTVTLIKDLDVKGAGFTAKRGTVVKNIALTDNPKHIEGRVNGVRLVLVADFMKKVS
ncbi:PhnA domain-containing protein [methanotrophic endosymbiont of Bathymodiolus puteoserpentis (Logatchev)]|jgi:protein PhnA|uniref:PhnA domain-containing protein n=1 Tax=methanotrophic endosymbiont of Bathymodiolus puteoserpentis (Logatchev) TaxID=343235 RepID=UPI0013C8EA3D|nr:alkylphosphonate utilization protein [methanotrophic endosymbiont of Bathymodiolus puteoserpentis (Logatchev)]SHE22592.1 Alkylphosphonate utilization operon protein PhnA [methanotrophic endosymbiont of Bathymodiolus puteoserpentis (Logatchev)]